MNESHSFSTTDPVTGFNIENTRGRPFLVEGTVTNNLTIYFESDATRQAYIDIPIQHPEQGLKVTLDNPTDDY
ncbi:MAG: hypothetical protein ACYDHM_03580 [Acidiferrobacterales bacterium]